MCIFAYECIILNLDSNANDLDVIVTFVKHLFQMTFFSEQNSV